MENERKSDREAEREQKERSKDPKRRSSGSTPEEDLMERDLDVAHEGEEHPGEGAAEDAGDMGDTAANPP